MPKLRFVPALLALPSVLLVASVAGAVVAPGNLPALCGNGPACEPGFECAVVGESGCSAPACAPGQKCPDQAPCATTIEYGCVPAHCVSDAQCAPGMVCHAWTESCPSCACPANEPNCNCALPACDPVSVSVCTPRYDLPCQVASDCGPGFTCEDLQSCGCASSGTAGSPSSAGAAPAPIPQGGSSAGSGALPPPDCSCTPTGQKQCVAQQIMCTTLSNTMCPAGWMCEPLAATQPACPPDSTCIGIAPSTSGWCRPPYYGAQSSGDLNHPETSGSGGAVGSTGGSTSTGPGMGTGTGQAAAGPVPTGTGTGMTGAGGSSTTPTSPAQPGASSGDSHEVAACSFGRAPASSAWVSLLALAGALFGLKRRRA